VLGIRFAIYARTELWLRSKLSVKLEALEGAAVALELNATR
jgi:hypothetical protein